MSRRRIAYVTLAIVIAIAVAAIAWSRWHPSRRLETASQSPVIGKAQVGQRAPEFQVSTTGGLFDLNKTNKPVFLEVFATWCPHCQRETTVVDRLYRNFGSRVDFVGVSGSETAMDGFSQSSQLDVLQWAQRFNVQYPIAYDPLLNVANLYLNGGFPTFAVVDRNKNVTYLNSGEIPYDELSQALKKALS